MLLSQRLTAHDVDGRTVEGTCQTAALICRQIASVLTTLYFVTPEASSSDLEVWRSSEILIPACITHWSHLTPETTYELFEGKSARVTRTVSLLYQTEAAKHAERFDDIR